MRGGRKERTDGKLRQRFRKKVLVDGFHEKVVMGEEMHSGSQWWTQDTPSKDHQEHTRQDLEGYTWSLSFILKNLGWGWGELDPELLRQKPTPPEDCSSTV